MSDEQNLKSNPAPDYEELRDEKAERRDKKGAKKMEVHGSGLFEVWKMKADPSAKDIKKNKKSGKKKNKK